MDPLQFEPRHLIGPPFRECPRCSKPDFGSVCIDGLWQTRRCRECFFTKTEPLWPLQKKVLYIDQFAISNMMKALNVTARSHDRVKADPFWLSLFEALERVCKLQLAICPDSEQHQEESLVSPFFAALKRMYEQLSHGVTFFSTERIVHEQLQVAATAWARGQAPVHDLTPDGVTSGGGGVHAWQDRLIISVNMNYPGEMVDAIREFRDRVHAGIVSTFDEYQRSSERSYEYWLERERGAPRRGIILSMAKRAKGELVQSQGFARGEVIWHALSRAGVPPTDLPSKFREFLDSDAFRDIPESLIAARMWAVIGQKATSGQKEPPNQGTANDVNIVSGLLPYCDAMLIDNKCRALLDDVPKKYALPYPTKVFSRSNGDQFLEYLERLERETDPVILRLVHHVYGDNWPTPFLTMYERARKRADNNDARG